MKRVLIVTFLCMIIVLASLFIMSARDKGYLSATSRVTNSSQNMSQEKKEKYSVTRGEDGYEKIREKALANLKEIEKERAKNQIEEGKKASSEEQRPVTPVDSNKVSSKPNRGITGGHSVTEPVIQSGENYQRKNRPYLGVSVDETGGEGVRVTWVEENSAASAIGLQQGDTIVAFNGERINSYGALVEAVSRAHPGDVVTVRVKKQDGSECEMNTTLGSRRNFSEE